MLRRLATTAAVLTLTACSEGLYYPTEVTRQENLDDRLTVMQDTCYGFASSEIKALIPACDGR